MKTQILNNSGMFVFLVDFKAMGANQPIQGFISRQYKSGNIVNGTLNNTIYGPFVNINANDAIYTYVDKATGKTMTRIINAVLTIPHGISVKVLRQLTSRNSQIGNNSTQFQR